MPTEAEKEGGGPPPGRTASHHQNRNPHHHDQAADGVQSNGAGRQNARADDAATEAEPSTTVDSFTSGEDSPQADVRLFRTNLDKLGVPLWVARPGGKEFIRPDRWPELTPDGNDERLKGFVPGMALCANTGGAVVVVDVDPRNGGDIEKVRALLKELRVRIFGEIESPSGGIHFYIAGHPDLPTVHSTTKNNKLPGYPGVDIQSYGANVFGPGTRRPKYNGRGYTIVVDDLDSLISEGDPEGADRFADWVADQTASHIRSCAKGKERSEFTFDPAPEWDGTPPDERQQKYLDTALTAEAKKVSQAEEGGRNDALNIAALKLGHYIAGAGLDQDKVIAQLELAAIGCGLADDDGVESVHATIRSGLRAGIKTPKAVPNGKMSHQEFWEKTDTLRHVRDFAHARRVGPWGLLGVSLARVLATVPPTVVLPPLVGGNASLNLFIGLVAESGDFKGTSQTAAKDAFRLGPVYTTGVGSGEGINHLFAHYDKKLGTVMDRWSVLFSVPEIDTLTALGNRNGTTLFPQLRKAWSGEALTFGYVDRTKALVIEEHAYRLSLVAGIQPGRARALLEDSDGGTPQRFVWLPTKDPDMPRIKPQEPEQIDLRGIAQGWPEVSMGSSADQLRGSLTATMNEQDTKPFVFALPEGVAELIDNNAVNKHHGEGTDSTLNGHLGLCRIKVAAALALLHNERETSSVMWDLSGVVMDMSQETRRGIEKHLAEQGDKVNRARGRAEGIRTVVSEEIREDANIQRVSRHILTILGKDEFKGKGKWSDVRSKVARRDTKEGYFEPAVEALKTAGQVVLVAGEHGESIELVGD